MNIENKSIKPQPIETKSIENLLEQTTDENLPTPLPLVDK